MPDSADNPPSEPKLVAPLVMVVGAAQAIEHDAVATGPCTTASPEMWMYTELNTVRLMNQLTMTTP